MKKRNIILLLSIISAFFIGVGFHTSTNQQAIEINATSVIENSTLPNTANSSITSVKQPSQWATDIKTIFDTPVGWGTLTIGGALVIVITIFSQTSLGKKTYKKYEKITFDLNNRVDDYKNKADVVSKEISKLYETIEVLNAEIKNLYDTLKSQTRNSKIKNEIATREKELENLMNKIKGGSGYGEK